MLVELVGRPGSGKSTVAVLLDRRRVGQTTIEVFSGALHSLNSGPASGPRARLPRRILSCLAAPLAAPRSAWLLLRIRQSAFGSSGLAPSLLITFILESTAFIRLTKQATASIRLLEEGPVQWVFSLTCGGDVQRALPYVIRYFRNVYGSVVPRFFYLQAVPDLCVSRFIARNQHTSTFNRSSTPKAIEELRSYPFDALIDGLRTATGAVIGVADAGRPVARTADDLLLFLAPPGGAD